MNDLRTCLQCGDGFRQDSPEGLCPKCLLAAALESEAALPSPSHKTMDLPFETLAAAPVGTKLSYFGDYELVQEIARGGMGVVYKARQVSLNRIVAIKMILSGQQASETEVKRFHTEAEAAANLQHPNIVAIHEVGVHEGRHYFSMDYVAGKNLSELIKGGPLPPAQAAQYVKSMAEAIQYAHQRGILHRDLKPQNVLIDEFDQPRITDFGLARQLRRDSNLTQEGAVMGSPSYMPPEQAAGKLAQVGPQSDVYSLGTILYELLTGKAPFRAETPMATLVKVLEAEPVRPKSLNPRVPADLETICLKCLEKRPERRYQSARDLAEEVGRYLDHDPILARPPSFIRKTWNWSVRHPWVITGIISLLALGLFSAAYGLWQQNRYLVWLQARPGHVRIPGRLSSELEVSAYPIRLLLFPMAMIFWWAFHGPDTIKRRRRRGRPYFHLALCLCGGCGAALLLVAVYSALKALEAHVWENYPLHIEGVSLGLWLFCAASGLAASLLHHYQIRRMLRKFNFSPKPDVIPYFIAILAMACFCSGLAALQRAFGDFFFYFLLSWGGIDLVRKAIREYQAALSISIDSHGLIPEEVQRIERLIFAREEHLAAIWFQFYSSERGTKEAELLDKSASASPEAKAYIEKLALKLLRKHPDRFSPSPTKEKLRKERPEPETLHVQSEMLKNELPPL